MSVLVAIPSEADAYLPGLTEAFVQSRPALYFLFSKGSPELVLEHCQWVQVAGERKPIDANYRNQILSQNVAMASRGLRVLGLAYRLVEAVATDSNLEQHETDLIWLGLTGMLDAPRPEVKTAVEKW